MPDIAQALTRLFERHRIVFWYDDKSELRAEFDSLALDGVEKIVPANDEFGVKFRILRREPAAKFLIYQAGPAPADGDNWLLDVQLAQGEFRADRAALVLAELGLGPEFGDVVRGHADFFQSAKRREALAKLLKPDDTQRQIRLKMVAVCANSEPRLDAILESLLDELAGDSDDALRLVTRAGLDGFLWEQVARQYGYQSQTPGVRDLALTLFRAGYALALGEGAPLNAEARVFIQRWKDSVRHRAAFEALSGQCAYDLDIEQDLARRDLQALAELDLFELVDQKVLSDLARQVADRTLSPTLCAERVRRRRQSFWYERYAHAYTAIEAAATFLGLVNQVALEMHSLAEGIAQYSRVWYQLDQLYRQFVYHLRRSGQTTLLQPLWEQVENHYTNSYLLPLNNRWQEWVDAAERWSVPGVMAQQDFFEEQVQPFLVKGNKVSVVISDALRYEVGEELLRRIRQEDRFDAALKPGLAMLPSFTQLGMAALLPHKQLAFAEHDPTTVLVDGVSSKGTENRRKILAKALDGKATAIQATDLLALGRDESRALIRDHDVVYVYHNQIDDMGDKRDSEERVFDAAEAALEELVRIVKKLANANANNLVVTADHGFIYQHRPLEESDFAGQEATGAQIDLQDRRFVVGRGFQATGSFRHFAGAAVGLSGEAEIMLPKSINRLRLKGAGSRYVHGGATLQEVVIPVLQINKKRQSDVRAVEVDILRSGSEVISTGQVSVAFFQVEPVDDKVQPIRLRAGIYTQAGELLSDTHELTFDLAAEQPRERERRVQFVLTKKADSANEQTVELRLEERVPDTSHYRLYKSMRYRLRRSFTADFDL